MATGRFPTKDDERNTFYNTSIPYLITNKVRLNVSADTVTALNDLRTEWNDVYPKAKNPAESTRPLRERKDQLIKEIENTMRSAYGDIPESALTLDDRLTLNLPERDSEPSPRPAITQTPFIKVNSREGAQMEFICRTDSDASRASINPDSDGIELVYKIGDPAPATPSECNRFFISSKAKFNVKLDVSDAGKKMHGFARWKNTSDDNKSGPWTSFSGLVND